jgi:hypothetical protein
VVTGTDQVAPWKDESPAPNALEDLADVVAEVSAEAEAHASGAVPVYRDRDGSGGQPRSTVATYPVLTADADPQDFSPESGSHEPYAMSAPEDEPPEDKGSASGWSLSRFTRGLGQL